jgi:uncharacterized cupin superfamily protein
MDVGGFSLLVTDVRPDTKSNTKGIVMSQGPQQTVVVQQSPGTSGIGMAGLIFSILGWFTCGLLCIPGAALSFLGLFSRGSKGAAIAGLIVGFPGVIFFVFVGTAILGGLLGPAFNAAQDAAERTRQEAEARERAASQHVESVDQAEAEPVTDANLPSPTKPETTEVTPEAMPIAEAETESKTKVESEPESESQTGDWRTWRAAVGGFQVEAEYVEAFFGTVTLRKRDGTTIQVDVAKLSEADQAYVKERKGY